MLLNDQVAVVTGGTAGIGRAIALRYAEEGAQVIILGTNQERGHEVTEEIKSKTGREATFYEVEISKTVAVDEIIRKILETFGRVDILVNNAGINADQLLMKMSEEEWDRVIDVNLKSCYNTCHAVMRSMVKAKKGRIINISSVVGIGGNAGQTNYAASKAGMIGFTKALAKELGSRGVLVNCIAPGYIETPMTAKLNEKHREAIMSQIPLGCFGSPEDIAHAALFLASDGSRFITGEVITVSGGMII